MSCKECKNGKMIGKKFVCELKEMKNGEIKQPFYITSPSSMSCRLFTNVSSIYVKINVGSKKPVQCIETGVVYPSVTSAGCSSWHLETGKPFKGLHYKYVEKEINF